MDGAHEVPYVWVGGDSAAQADGARALREWGLARGLKIAPAAASGPRARPPLDLAASDEIEAELDRARDAIAALDAERADRALARAETIARAHPELPHASWLLSEVLRGWSLRWSRLEPKSLERAATAWQDAEALSGAREAGFGEIARPKPPETLDVELGFDAKDGRVSVTVDGAPTRPGAIKLAAGPHQVVVLRDGAPTWSSFVHVAAPGRLGLPTGFTAGDCEIDDLARAKLDPQGGVQAQAVRCGEWIAVAPADRPGAVRVATCTRGGCGAFLEWRASGAFSGPPQSLPRARPWPAWATWTLVGVGAATAACITAVATGVFESRPTEPRFTNGGAQVH